VRTTERIDLTARLSDEERTTQEEIEGNIRRLNMQLLHGHEDASTSAVTKSALADARARWEQLQTTLYVRHGLRRAPAVVDPLVIPEVLLPTPEDVILDFVVTDRQTILFVLSRPRGGEMTIDVHTIAVGTVALRADVDHFLNRLASANFDYEDDARRLYRLLIGPAEKRLQGKTVVAIVADGPLWRLPFQALQGDDGKPLLTRFVLFSAPSLLSLSRADGHREAQPSILAIGNPRVSAGVTAAVQSRTRAALGDLPEAAVEARAVAALYDRAHALVLTGNQATEQAVKESAPRYDILHVAAHAITDDRQPLYSSILLASGQESAGEDGLLEGREITRLALNARLTVLSACSTAQGYVRPGEGLIGLSWAFLVAGCPAIVASQWRVPSVSTSKLMVDFHRELARGNRTVAEALRLAQLRMMKNPRYRHPFYWSAFVVIGAGRS
jgi:CHAT domain-containing protein